MLLSANRAVARAGLAPRIHLAWGDATRFDSGVLFRNDRFERVYISYSLSMIPEWRRALEMALTLVAPGGELHVVDFGGQEGLPVLLRRLLRTWLARFHVTPRDDLEAVLRGLCVGPGWTLAFERPFAGFAQYARIGRGR
jgi:S-adenosylmethionine-diacylgycerolhomoserine-N-methlytransferase